ncbi:hypothetical protein OIV83_003957 [Microbotryomycetes sp. JL201]|nr:hypothetical protein OIV83_003957 [Microbotryomycetes sp. JL201]
MPKRRRSPLKTTTERGVSVDYTSSEAGDERDVQAAQAASRTPPPSAAAAAASAAADGVASSPREVPVQLQDSDAGLEHAANRDSEVHSESDGPESDQDQDFHPSSGEDEDEDYEEDSLGLVERSHKRSRSTGSTPDSVARPLPRKLACTECYRRKTVCSGLHQVAAGDQSSDVKTDELALIGLAPAERQQIASIAPTPRISRRVGELSPHAAASLVNEFFDSGGWRLPLEPVPFEFTRDYLIKGCHQTVISELIFQATVAHATRWTFIKAVTHCRISTLDDIRNAKTDQRNHLSVTREKRIDVMREKASKMLDLTPVRDSPKFEHLCVLYMLYEGALSKSAVRWEESRINLLIQYLSLKPRRSTLAPEQQAFVDHVARKVMLWDALTSIYLQRPLLASDELLSSVYDWSQDRANEALELFRAVKSKEKKTARELELAVFDVVVQCLRMIAQDPYDPAPSADEWSDTISNLSQVRSLLDSCYTVLQVVPVENSDQPNSTVTTASFSQLNDISACLISVEAALTHHTERICQHVLSSMACYQNVPMSQVLQEPKHMIDRAQVAFLHALKVDLYFCASEELNNPFSARQRVNSARLSALEAYPRYLETALVGATHYGIVKSQAEHQARQATGGDGQGSAASDVVLIPPEVLASEFPLAPVEFGVDNLERLCTCLNSGAWFSAVASERATALAEALVRTNLVAAAVGAGQQR